MAAKEPLALLERAQQGFRTKYLDYAALTRQVQAWAEAFPEVVRLESLTKTVDGRDLWLLTIGPDPDRVRPAVWVDGNMHAVEVTGSSVALGIAEDVIRAHVAPEQGLRDLPAHVAELLRRDVLFYVLPRMSPDGAETVLSTGAYVRSNPRDARIGRSMPYWRACDVNGDGQARLMRRADPAGDFARSTDFPDLLLPRKIEDEGPFYFLFPEGVIENFDGVTIPGAGDFLADNATDMNRNFPYQWAPEPHQIGAGDFATSEPESRAVAEFAVRHPNIFAWLNLHTFGGCFIRPAGDVTDKKMNQRDLALYHQIEEWTEAITTYPMVSGYEEFTYEPDKPLAGDLEAFAYVQRGAMAIVCELWDFWKQVGLKVRRPFVINYGRHTRDEIKMMARWDREHNASRAISPWAPFDHPQLGSVEIGGYDPRIGIWNPPFDRIAEICDQQSRVLLRMAAMAPRLRVESVEVERLGADVFRVAATIANHGFLPTFVLDSSRALPWNDPVHATIALEGGLALVSGDERRDIGHLEGWGGVERPQAPSFARSAMGPIRKRVAWVVQGGGRAVVVAGCARVGQVEATVEVG